MAHFEKYHDEYRKHVYIVKDEAVRSRVVEAGEFCEFCHQASCRKMFSIIDDQRLFSFKRIYLFYFFESRTQTLTVCNVNDLCYHFLTITMCMQFGVCQARMGC